MMLGTRNILSLETLNLLHNFRQILLQLISLLLQISDGISLLMNRDLVHTQLGDSCLVFLHYFGQLLFIVLDSCREVSLLPTKSEETVFNVSLRPQSVVKVGLDVAKLQLGVLLGLHGGRAREFCIFQLELDKIYSLNICI